MDQKIELINELPLCIADIYHLTLVYAGKKPLTYIAFSCMEYDRVKLEFCDYHKEQRDAMLASLETIGLPYESLPIEERIPKSYDPDEFFKRHLYSRIYVYREKEDLNRIMKVKTNTDIGLCYGYPKTAAEAFGNWKKELPIGFEFPNEYKPYLNFKKFRMSKDHWKEEFSIVFDWVNTIKEINPKLYFEMIRKY